MVVLPNYPLFEAKSDIAEEINPGVIELGCFSDCIIPANKHFAVVHYDAKLPIREDDKQY